MERGKVMKTFHDSNLNPKSPTSRDRDTFFSPYLRPDQPCICEPDHAIKTRRSRTLDHDSTSELSIFCAHKYFNEVTNSSNSRVSPLVNMDTIHKHSPQRGGGHDITKTSIPHSLASPSADGHANIKNYKAHSCHAATPISASPSNASWNNHAGLLSHPPTSAVSVYTRNLPHNFSDLKKKIRDSLLKSISLLRRKCNCSGKKSVQVKKNIPRVPPTPPPHHSVSRNQFPTVNPRTPTTDTLTRVPKDTATKIPITHNKKSNSQRFQPSMNKSRRPFIEGFSFHAPNTPSASSSSSTTTTTTSPTKKLVLNVVHEDDPHPPRDSLEVFQPRMDKEGLNSPPPSSPKSRAMVDEDAASDASSDLFEIESFCTQPATVTCPMVTTTSSTISECHQHRENASVDLSFAKFFFAGDDTIINSSAKEGHHRGATITATASGSC